MSANLTLKPGSSDSFKVGIATVIPVGELAVTAPEHIPVIDWFAARVTLSLVTAVTVLNVGSVPVGIGIDFISLTFN